VLSTHLADGTFREFVVGVNPRHEIAHRENAANTGPAALKACLNPSSSFNRAAALPWCAVPSPATLPAAAKV
jgi:hypothetical protein